ncbi:MAG: HEPN domain-containing protein [Candidatus Bathyarchaeota archaeon]|nr:HEPN domain-containing protein [Candidatus Bathyarchaeota archaeon]
MTRREEAERLLDRSRRFLETADYQIERGFYDLAAFSLEQSLQLFLKARLLEYGAGYPRTHSVRVLLEALASIAPENKRDTIRALLNEHILELGILEDAYITSRYVMRDFRKGEIEKLKKTVLEVMNKC